MTTGNDYRRMTVVRWDKEFIHGTITDGDGHTEYAKVSYTTHMPEEPMPTAAI